jgi:hypothetical protein
LVKLKLQALKLEPPFQIALPQPFWRVPQIRPRQSLDFVQKSFQGRAVRLIVHVIAGIHGKEAVPGSNAKVDIRDGLEMVCISPPGPLPTLLKDAKHCIIYDLLRAPVRPGILPHRLLRQYGCKATDGPDGTDVSWRCKTKPVPATCGPLETQWLRV